jgi:hypothetical protein
MRLLYSYVKIEGTNTPFMVPLGSLAQHSP